MFTAALELIQNGTVPHEGFEHLRTGIAAGSSVPAELMKKLHKVLNLTELSEWAKNLSCTTLALGATGLIQEVTHQQYATE